MLVRKGQLQRAAQEFERIRARVDTRLDAEALRRHDDEGAAAAPRNPFVERACIGMAVASWVVILALAALQLVGCSSITGGKTNSSASSLSASGGSTRNDSATTTVTYAPDGSVTFTRTSGSVATSQPTVTASSTAAAAQQPSATGAGTTNVKGGPINGNASDGFTVGGYTFTATESRRAGGAVLGIILLVVGLIAFKTSEKTAGVVCIALGVLAFVYPEWLAVMAVLAVVAAAYVAWANHRAVGDTVFSTDRLLGWIRKKFPEHVEEAKTVLASGQNDSTEAVVAEHKKDL